MHTIPDLFATVKALLPAVAARLRAVRLAGRILPRWTLADGRVVVSVRLVMDPESDSLLADEARAVLEAREILIAAGCYVDAKGTTLRIDGFYGAKVAA